MTAASSSKMSTVVDAALVDRAVKALLRHDKSQSNEKESLLGNDKPIQVQFTLEKVPNHPSPKPIRVLIPYPLYKIDPDEDTGLEEPSVCLIVKEESKPWVQEMMNNFPKEMGFVKKVLGLQSLRKKHARYEQRRMLLSKYDLFMADDRILPMLGKALGKEFFKAKKQPIPITLTRKQALPFIILQSLQATFMFISSGTTLTVRAATTAMSPAHVLENIQAVINNAVPKIPGKWSNIRCIALKTPTSMSLPFYNKTPEELSVISKMAGLESKQNGEEEKMKKATKPKLAANSPLVQALKKQKKLEAEQKSQEKHTKKDKAESVKKASKEKDKATESEKKHKKKRSISTEIEVKETVVVESVNKKTKVDFIASKKYKGSKKGYVFRAGKQGVGYYVDVKPVVDRMAMEALKRSAAQSRGGGRKKKSGRKGRR